MPKRKNRNSSLFDQDKHTLEFSPGQLVLAICTVLLLGLVCFLAGVVVGRYDDSYTNASLFMRDTTAQQEEEQVAQREEPEEEDPDEEEFVMGEGRQVSPRPIIEPPDNRTQPRVTDLPSPFGNELDTREEEPARDEPDDAPEPPEEPDAPEDNGQPEDDEFAFEPLSPSDDLSLGDALAMAAEGGPFTIQVISYTAGDRALAEAYAEDIAEDIGYEPTLSLSEDGAFIRVFVGAFPDQEIARAAMEKLQEMEEFEDSFVRRRPNAT